jgi:hypothetical protein
MPALITQPNLGCPASEKLDGKAVEGMEHVSDEQRRSDLAPKSNMKKSPR